MSGINKRVFTPGILGKKLGMTQVFDSKGEAVPVTVVEAGPCFILAVRNDEESGYKAVQLGFGPKNMNSLSKAEKGHFVKSARGAFSHVKEIRCDIDALGWTSVGQEVRVAELFKDGQHVDVSGLSIGRGFQGVVKRHGMKGQPATRGTHEVRRHVGAVGCRKFPGRIFKNKRMPGHMGADNVTIQNLQVVGVKAEDNLILIRGGIPGPAGALVVVRQSKKKRAA